MAARDGVRSAATWTAPRIDQARAWTAPRINQARAWTAPQIERSGLAVKDTIAPKVYETLMATARRVDVTAPRPDDAAPRRRWPQVVAATGMLVAAGAAVAVVLRRRKSDRAYEAPAEPAEAVTGPQAAQDGQLGADADADGSGAEGNVSRQSQ